MVGGVTVSAVVLVVSVLVLLEVFVVVVLWLVVSLVDIGSGGKRWVSA